MTEISRRFPNIKREDLKRNSKQPHFLRAHLNQQRQQLIFVVVVTVTRQTGQAANESATIAVFFFRRGNLGLTEL